MSGAKAATATLPPAVLLMGPTASGKTDLAVDLVTRLPLEIVSVDSAMVYRDMDIGTAKPGPEIRAVAPHRLIDILDPADPYSAARFRVDALREMEAIVAGGKVPLLVGGTMLYFRALQQGLASLPQADPALRRRLESEAQEAGWPALHAQLARVDPEAGRRIHPNDPQRIQRALEVYELSGRPWSELCRTSHGPTLPFRPIKLALAPADRGVLHRHIALRFAAMLEEGLIEEVERLRCRAELDTDKPSMRAVGYRQVWEYLSGTVDYKEMERRAVVATRQLAKRQLTWLRSEPEVSWFDSLDPAHRRRAVSLIARELP